jgi:metal-responsive CopG/Arc/MetJ family transcriptional regulator
MFDLVAHSRVVHQLKFTRSPSMKVTIDMDEALVAAIDQAARIQSISRDAAFSEALKTWVAHKPKSDRCEIDFSKL